MSTKARLRTDLINVDTDVLVWFLRGDQKTIDQLYALYDSGAILICSTLVTLEILRGARHRKHGKKMAETFMRTIGQVPVTEEIALEAARLYHMHQRKGKTLPFVDSIIAATSYVENASLLTRNKKDFPAEILL